MRKLFSGILVILIFAGCAAEPVAEETFEPTPVESGGETIDEVTGLRIEAETGLLLMYVTRFSRYEVESTFFRSKFLMKIPPIRLNCLLKACV